MAEKSRQPAQIETGSISGDLGPDGAKALHVDIEYPRVSGCPGDRMISAFYRARAEELYRFCIQGPLREAMRQKSRLREGFVPLQVGRSFSVMYNEGGLLSIFSDSFAELGEGGSRLYRMAQTWVLSPARTPRFVPAGSFFRPGSPWVRTACEEIAGQLIGQVKDGASGYFSNALQRSKKLSGYYLADDGFVFYYPVGALGPRSLGIPSFLVPYTAFGNMLARPL